MKRSLLCVLILLSEYSHAIEQKSVFESSRNWGRGGAYVAAYDSDEATRFNPATLAETDISFQMRFYQLDLSLAEATVDTINDLADTSGSEDGLSFMRKFDDKFGDKQFFRGQFSPLSMRFGAFEFSPFVVLDTTLEINSPTLPESKWLSDTYAGASFSYSRKFFTSLALGLTLRPMYRWKIDGKIGFTDLMDFLPPASKQFSDISPIVSGFGLGVDVGGVWQVSPKFRWGLVVQNVGDMGYFQDYSTKPEPFRQKFSTGILSRNQWGPWNLDFLADIQDLENRDGLNLLRLLHYGLEFGTSVISRDHDYGILLGVNEGYITTGVFLDLLLVRFDISNYAVEDAFNPGQDRDRRWAFSARTTMTF